MLGIYKTTWRSRQRVVPDNAQTTYAQPFTMRRLVNS